MSEHWSGLTPAQQSEAATEAAQEREYRAAQDAADKALSEMMRVAAANNAQLEKLHRAYLDAENRLEALRRERYPEIYADLDAKRAGKE